MNKKIALAVIVSTTTLCIPSLAAAKLANPAQKGSLLIFPHIEVKSVNNAKNVFSDTYVVISNDSFDPVTLQCFWSTTDQFAPTHPLGAGGNIANKWARDAIRNSHQLDFSFALPPHSPATFWAGDLSFLKKPGVHVFSNGWNKTTSFANPPMLQFITPNETNVSGELKCWAVTGIKQIHHNHLIGKATIVNFAPMGTATAPTTAGQAYEYKAWSFQGYYQGSSDIKYTGKTLSNSIGILNLNGKEYDQCPSALLGQFPPTYRSFGKTQSRTHISLSNCHQDLRPKSSPHVTELLYTIWDGNGTKGSTAKECMGAWYESDLGKAFPHFTYDSLKTETASFRVRTVTSNLCANSKGNASDVETSGIVGVQTSNIGGLFQTGDDLIGLGGGTDVSPVNTAIGQIQWHPN